MALRGLREFPQLRPHLILGEKKKTMTFQVLLTPNYGTRVNTLSYHVEVHFNMVFYFVLLFNMFFLSILFNIILFFVILFNMVIFFVILFNMVFFIVILFNLVIFILYNKIPHSKRNILTRIALLLDTFLTQGIHINFNIINI